MAAMAAAAIPSKAQRSSRSPSPAAREHHEQVNLGPIICSGHSRPISDLTYSNVVNNEYFLISASLDKNPMLRKGPTGDWIGTFAGHKGAVWSARLNSNNTLAVTASGDFTVKLWNAVNGTEIREFVHRHIAKSAVFSCDNRRIYSGGQEKKVRVFDIESDSVEPVLILEGHSKSVCNVAPVPGQPDLLMSSGDDNDVRIWDLRAGTVVNTLPTNSAVCGIEISKTKNILTVSTGNEVKFWDLSSFTLLKSHTLDRDVKCASLHPNGSSFVCGSNSELWARLYDFETGKKISCLKGHHGPVRCIAFSPMGNAFASGSEDGTIRVWEQFDQSSDNS